MSWIEIESLLPAEVGDLSPYIEIYRQFGIENTLEGRHSLTGCLVQTSETGKVVEALALALKDLGAISVTVRDLPEENWDELWRRHFKPRRIGERFVVRPSWEEFEARPEDLVITLDPGQAFGTGEHATTKMCLEMLEKTPIRGKNVLDLGCGSGILSIAAKLLGASEVVAVDIDPLAVEVSLENAKRNNVQYNAITGDGLEGLEGTFDVLISNIISATLIRLSAEAARYITPGGIWIVSGVIVQNWPDVLQSVEESGFMLQSHLEEDGWVAARFSRAG